MSTVQTVRTPKPESRWVRTEGSEETIVTVVNIEFGLRSIYVRFQEPGGRQRKRAMLRWEKEVVPVGGRLTDLSKSVKISTDPVSGVIRRVP